MNISLIHLTYKLGPLGDLHWLPPLALGGLGGHGLICLWPIHLQ